MPFVIKYERVTAISSPTPVLRRAGHILAEMPVSLRAARPDDIPSIIALEGSPVAREFVRQWNEERHRATLGSEDARYFVAETETGGVAGYAILRGLAETGRSIELKRVVVATPERGLGRKMLTELLRIAFELHAHRLFLDVFEDNMRARHLYESLGFTYEGTMRDAAQRNGAWCNLLLMSMLEEEYALKRQPRP